MVQPASKYGSFYPTVTDKLAEEGVNLMIAICCVSDDKGGLTGEFRVAMNSRDDMDIPLDIHKVLGEDVCKNLKFSFPVAAKDLRFMNNRWHTEWYSFKDELDAGNITIAKENQDNESFEDLVIRIRREILSKESGKQYDCCFRLEVGCPTDEDLDINIRWLPSNINFLKNHSRLNGGDVATINGGNIKVFCPTVSGNLRDLLKEFPVAPTVFYEGENEMTADEYVKAVNEHFPAITVFIKAHADITIEQAKSYVKSPTANTGNVQRFKPKRKHTEATNPTSHASGTYTLSKFGTKHNIWGWIGGVSNQQRKKICLSKATSTWDSYLTTWRTFSKYCTISRRKSYIPVEADVLCGYVCYLHDCQQLQFDTIKSYLSGLKKLHSLNMVSVKAFECERLQDILQGIKNQSTLSRVVSNDKQYRCEMTWSDLRMYLWKCEEYSDYDKQVIRTLSLFCFYGALRGGEILSKEEDSFDPFRAITWCKIKKLSDVQLLVVLVVPKTSEDPEGVVVDIFKYPADVAMCPVVNLEYLIGMVKTTRGLMLDDPVFRLSDGKLLTTSAMNGLLKKFLKPLFPHVQFSCHSFRAGLPSHMATNPEKFSLEEAKISGRWKSETVKRYQRLNGIAQKHIIAKFYNFLQCKIYYFYGIYDYLHYFNAKRKSLPTCM